MIKFAKHCTQYLVTGNCFVFVNAIVLISALSNALDVSCENAMIDSNPNKGLTPSKAIADESFTEVWEFVMVLIKPRMGYRLNNAPNLTDCLRNLMMPFQRKRVAIHPQVDPQPKQSEKRCAICVDEVKGKGYSAKRNKLSEVVYRCCWCNMPLCSKHKLNLRLLRKAM